MKMSALRINTDTFLSALYGAMWEPHSDQRWGSTSDCVEIMAKSTSEGYGTFFTCPEIIITE